MQQEYLEYLADQITNLTSQDLRRLARIMVDAGGCEVADLYTGLKDNFNRLAREFELPLDK